MFDLSSLVLVELPLLVDVLRNYTLEFEIRVERALINLRECLRETVRDRDCYRGLADAFMEDIKEMSSAHESELATLRAELNQRRLAPPDTEVKCVQLRSKVTGLEVELANFTQRFASLDHN